MRFVVGATLVFAASVLSTGGAFATPIHANDYASLVTAINEANSNPGSVIDLAPNTYSGGALPFVTASMTIERDPSAAPTAGDVILDTTPMGKKGIITVPDTATGVNLMVKGLIFENAAISKSDGQNAAGIRDQSQGDASLIVFDSTFLSNQDGILTGHGGANPEQLKVSISDSLFANNGTSSGQQHGIYIFGASLQVSNSVFCGTTVGHDIKSRAAVTTVTGSTLYDAAADPNDPVCHVGSTSYAVDLPNGGAVSLSNDQFVQGAATQNSTIVAYGEEGDLHSTNSLTVSDDSFVSSVAGYGIWDPNCPTPVQVTNTTFSSSLTPVLPATCVASGPTAVDEPASAWIGAVRNAVGILWRDLR